MIKTVQKIIKIGSSHGVTIPKKALQKLGAEAGDELMISIDVVKRPRQNQAKLMQEYDAFVKEYGSTLKNLAGR